MPQKLSERPEELLRQFLTDNLTPSEMQGYDPQQTDETATDFMPVTSSWNKWGDVYPIIAVTEQDGPTIPNSGTTNFNGLQGDGSGPNQYTVYNITVSCQAVELENSGSYRNSTSADDLVDDLYQEVHATIQNNATTAISEALFVGLTPPTQTRSSEEADSGSTLNWIQRQGTCAMGVINEP